MNGFLCAAPCGTLMRPAPPRGFCAAGGGGPAPPRGPRAPPGPPPRAPPGGRVARAPAARGGLARVPRVRRGGRVRGVRVLGRRGAAPGVARAGAPPAPPPPPPPRPPPAPAPRA